MDLLERLLGHDSWTTGRLLELAGTLGDPELDREFDIGHRTVRRTLEHVVWNVECWTDLMQGRSVRTRPVPGQPVADLAQRHRAASAELLRLARQVVDGHRLDDTFLDTLDDLSQAKTFGGAIVHLATHGMHHRAQLVYMLRRLGVEGLPEGDVLSWEQSLGFKPGMPTPKAVGAVDSSPTPEELDFLDVRLGQFNAEQTGRDDFRPLDLVLRGDDRLVVAGLRSVTGWDWLHVRVLWVHESRRRQGLGSTLLEAAEAEARRRGCIGACLSSFNFQAPGFYERHGYTAFGRVEDYPPGHTLHFLSKRFQLADS
jgi:uncharacterized damage-inducible protein DinB/GNAT superfamily N-acetyltransferase